MDTVLGFITGILISVIAWWIINALFAPRILFSKKIAKTQRGHFQVAIQNSSRWRDVCDIYAYIRFRFASGNYYSAKLGHVLLLEKQTGKSPYSFKQSPRISSIILEIDGYKDADGKLHSIDDFFEVGGKNEDSFIEIFILGRDVFNTSSKKLVKARYFHKDISYNSCIKKGTVEVVEISENYGVQI